MNNYQAQQLDNINSIIGFATSIMLVGFMVGMVRSFQPEKKYRLVKRTKRGSLVAIRREGDKAIIEVPNVQDMMDLSDLLNAAGIKWEVRTGISKSAWEGTPAHLRSSIPFWHKITDPYPGNTVEFNFADLELVMGQMRPSFLLLEEPKEHHSSSNITTKWNPAESYFHGTYDVENIAGIISEGLRPGSSVSSWKGQATAYPIILEYGKLVVEQVSYRPEDFKLLERSGKPKAIYVVVADYVKVRDIDEINRDLAVVLERLEVQGIATPERVGDLIANKDFRALKELDEKLPHLAREMDAFIERGPSPGGEGIFKRVSEQAGSIPVYRIGRDEVGEIDWRTRRK